MPSHALRRSLLPTAGLLLVLLGAGCSDQTGDQTLFASLATERQEAAAEAGNARSIVRLKHDADRTAEGVDGLSVCGLLPAARVRVIAHDQALQPQGTDSLDQSTCRYGHGDVNVRVLLDGAPDATRRFFNMQAEAEEFRSQGKAPPTQNIKGLGDDSTYGDAGAYWTPDRELLVTFRGDRIIRVIPHLPGSSAHRLAVGEQVTRALAARLPAAVDQPGG